MTVSKKTFAKKSAKLEKVVVIRVYPTKKELERVTKKAISKYRVAVKRLAKR